MENKKRGNFQAFRNPAYSWPLCRATQQHQLGVKAGSTPRQHGLHVWRHVQPYKEERCWAKLHSDFTFGPAPFELNKEAFLSSCNCTWAAILLWYENKTWILPDSIIFTHWSLEVILPVNLAQALPKLKTKSQLPLLFLLCMSLRELILKLWVLFHSHAITCHHRAALVWGTGLK